MFNIEQSYGCLNIIDYYADGRATVKLLNGWWCGRCRWISYVHWKWKACFHL